MTTPIKSPLRYPGGKSRAIQKIYAQLPAQIGEFREPFVGGASVFLAVKSLFKRNIAHYWINDIHPDLVAFWTWVKEDVDALIRAVERLKSTHDSGRNLYESLRNPHHEYTNFERAVRFFIMNRITFSGVMDAGGYSQQAYESRFTPSSVERVKNVAEWMLNTQITQGDYETLLQAQGQDVFIFLDPPYYSVTHSKLYGVRGELHTGFDHERFAEQMRRCNHRWLITYDDSEKVRNLFSFANIIEWELQYGMNNYKQGKADKGRELFIKNY